MQLVEVQKKNFDDYRQFIDEETEFELDFLVQKLKDKKIAMINATAFGGGVAEKLHSLVPLMKAMGINIDWWTILGHEEFYNITKNFHNCLQGQEGVLPVSDVETYLKYNQMNASYMKDWEYDYIIIHDPQPAALIESRRKKKYEKWIWRCHIDTSSPNKEYWDFLYNYIVQYDAVIFTMHDYAKEGIEPGNITIITPSIDPLSIKNIPLKKEEAEAIICKFGVDTNRPLISQVSRFDPWKDPLGVIDAYKIVKKDFPSVQLALVGSMAYDDPEGWDYLYSTLRRAGEDYDIKVVTNFNGISDLEVNAFQTASDIILQKSLREGFGLTVAESLWKGTPVIGGNVGGIKLQIEDGVTGYMVNTVEECAEKILTLLRNPVLAEEMKEAAREKVRKEFLVTKNIQVYLRLFYNLGFTAKNPAPW
ncbi:MAG: glycosyltransferase [Firmicutes bacterium]|nr:glycosyltransferase [Bacillota bacterium]